jgi:Putative transposase of IS4/5 family (DUF4096)
MNTTSDTKRLSWEWPDAIWQRLEACLPPTRGQEGHPRTVNRRRLPEGICSGLRTGIPGHAGPRERVGPPSTVDDDVAPWGKAGGFAPWWAEALAVDDDLKGLEWTWQRVAGARPKAPLGGRSRAPLPRTVARVGRNAGCCPQGRGVPWRWSGQEPIAMP